MATTRSDIDSMLSKLSPLRAAPPEPDARVIAHRWEYHKPFVLMRSRQSTDPADAFAFYKARHADYLTRLRRALIAPEVIFRRNLDNPLETPMQFEWQLAQAIERRRARLGRVKGRGKKYRNRKDTK